MIWIVIENLSAPSRRSPKGIKRFRKSFLRIVGWVCLLGLFADIALVAVCHLGQDCETSLGVYLGLFIGLILVAWLTAFADLWAFNRMSRRQKWRLTDRFMLSFLDIGDVFEYLLTGGELSDK